MGWGGWQAAVCKGGKGVVWRANALCVFPQESGGCSEMEMDAWKGMRMVLHTPPVCAFLPNRPLEKGETSLCALPCAPPTPTDASCSSVTEMEGADSPST